MIKEINMTQPLHELDVRPILRAGGEPFAAIMSAANSLAPGQGLKLIAPFEPVPLYAVLAKKGLAPAPRPIGGGDWEVVFGPAESGTTPAPEGAPPEAASASAWPEPSRHLDNRDLDPPEPMVRTLAAVEELQPGEVLCALLCREPIFLLPELQARGHAWQGGFEPGGAYKLLVRKGLPQEAAA